MNGINKKLNNLIFQFFFSFFVILFAFASVSFNSGLVRSGVCVFSIFFYFHSPPFLVAFSFVAFVFDFAGVVVDDVLYSGLFVVVQVSNLS